ncbi:MAG: SDR family oxidoreductase [Pseudomonadota bacterium]
MKKVALITGGATGIGLGLVEEMYRDHAIATTAHVSPTDRLLACAPETLVIEVDLATPGAAAQVVAQTYRRFGRIDVIVNNAGAMATDDTDKGQIHAVNLAAPMALVEAALPHLTAGAAIINISSVNATLPAMGALSYSASKSALNTWTRGLAKTLGPRGIRVNAVAPGAIERTEKPRPPELLKKFVEMTALGRAGTPADIAKVVRFLASPDAGYITGEVITVSGGYRL